MFYFTATVSETSTLSIFYIRSVVMMSASGFSDVAGLSWLQSCVHTWECTAHTHTHIPYIHAAPPSPNHTLQTISSEYHRPFNSVNMQCKHCVCGWSSHEGLPPSLSKHFTPPGLQIKDWFLRSDEDWRTTSETLTCCLTSVWAGFTSYWWPYLVYNPMSVWTMHWERGNVASIFPYRGVNLPPLFTTFLNLPVGRPFAFTVW